MAGAGGISILSAHGNRCQQFCDFPEEMAPFGYPNGTKVALTRGMPGAPNTFIQQTFLKPPM